MCPPPLCTSLITWQDSERKLLSWSLLSYTDHLHPPAALCTPLMNKWSCNSRRLLFLRSVLTTNITHKHVNTAQQFHVVAARLHYSGRRCGNRHWQVVPLSNIYPRYEIINTWKHAYKEVGGGVPTDTDRLHYCTSLRRRTHVKTIEVDGAVGRRSLQKRWFFNV